MRGVVLFGGWVVVQEGRAYGKGRKHTFKSFRGTADAFRDQWFHSRGLDPKSTTSEEIEQEYWRIVQTGGPRTEVLLDTCGGGDHGGGVELRVDDDVLHSGGVRKRSQHCASRQRISALSQAVHISGNERYSATLV